MNFSGITIIKTICILLLGSSLAPACSVCFGDTESNMVQGMRMAILALFGVICSILISFAVFFIYLNKKGKSIQKLEGNLHA